MATAAATMSLKLLIDSKSQRVLFAEADKDFVDFLFSLLLLPVGTVTRLLRKQGMAGSLGNLYQSVENLGDSYILPTTSRDTLLKPTSSSSLAANVPLLLPDIQSSTPIQSSMPERLYGSSYRGIRRHHRRSSYSSAMISPITSDAKEGGYVKGVTYMILDDLSHLTVTPASTISSITMFHKLNVARVKALQEQAVTIGMKEGLELLKASMQSKTVLTDVFLAQKAVKKPSMRSKCKRLLPLSVCCWFVYRFSAVG